MDAPNVFHDRLRAESPVCFHPQLGMWLVSKYDDIWEILKDPARFSSTKTLGGSLDLSPEVMRILEGGFPPARTPINADPPMHTRLRRAISRAFSPARVAAQERFIRATAEHLVDGFVADGATDLIARFTYPLPVIVILHMLGFPREDLAQVKAWCGDLFALNFGRVPPEQAPQVAHSIVAYQRYCAALIEKRKREPQDDITSALVEGRDADESLTLPELVQTISGALLAAGHETTTHMIGKAVRLLLTDRSRWEMLAADRSLIPGALEETMRLDPVTHGMVRTANEDVVVGGVAIPRGADLLLLYSSGNHDEAHFPEPDRFDPRRDNQHHLTFGRGIHYCIGAPLARLEGRIALEVLLDRLPALRLSGAQPEHTLNVAIHGLKHLHVEWGTAG